MVMDLYKPLTGTGIRSLVLLWCLAAVLCCAPRAGAEEAEDLSGKALVTAKGGISSVNALFDGRTMESVTIRRGGYLTLESETGIASVYLVFGKEPGSYTVTDEAAGTQETFGEDGFLHEFLDLQARFGSAPQRVTIRFEEEAVQLAELSAFGPGQVPDWVQQWQPPAQEADLVLFSTHGDDEQLFFAGLLPYYAWERGYSVQVVYLTGHRNMSMRRSHEMLDGLWAVGVRHYPVFGPFGDYNSRSLAQALEIYRNKGIRQEDMLSFVVENIRRFRPKVAVGHDLQGEYGHGMHMLYADLLCKALAVSDDPTQFPESAERYGCWDVPKTYLHLYPENEIWMDWDEPLDSFGGMTAFQVTRDLGFPCHVSQQSYYRWYFQGIEAAADIPEYSPCAYGLYRSTVGPDVHKQDLFENLTTYAQDAQAEAELKAWQEASQTEPPQPSHPSPPPTEPPQTTPEPAPEPKDFSQQTQARILPLPVILSITLLFAAGIGLLSSKFKKNRRNSPKKK